MLLTLLLPGCNRSISEESQVVAIVGDEEITRAELELEARERGVPAAGDRQMRDALVRELVERKLLVQLARREKLDRSPEFVLASRRLGEVTLAQRLLSGLESDSAPPPAIARYIAQNPRAFAQRAYFSVDYVQLPAPLDENLRARLQSAGSGEDIVRLLASAGVKGTRRQELWDSASLTPAMYEAIRGMKPGQGFVIPVGGAVLAGILSFTSAQPVAEDQRAALAQAMIQQEAKQKVLRQLLQEIEPRTRIVYAPQFAPAPAATGR